MTTSLLGSLMQDTTGSVSHRIPMQPQGLKAWQIKHNAKDGTLSILLPDADENEDGRPTTIEGLASASFVPVYAYRNAHGSIDDDTVGSNPSLSATRFDCYVYHDSGTESLGILTDKEIKDGQDFGVGQRFFGFMTAVDGKKITDDERFAKYVPESGLVFCYTQFTPYKLYQMVKALNLDYSTCNTQLINHLHPLKPKTRLQRMQMIISVRTASTFHGHRSSRWQNLLMRQSIIWKRKRSMFLSRWDNTTSASKKTMSS